MECFDSQGFYHTGDMGYFDNQTGDLALAGRIKELIITSGGENVAPIPIELAIKDLCPIISNCVVVGDGERYLSALITLRVNVSRQTGRMTNDLAADVLLFLLTKLDSKSRTVEEARKDKNVFKFIQECVDKANLKAVSRVQEVKRWVIIDGDFSIESGEMTPTGKVKRNVVYKQYETQIAQMY